MLQITSKGEKKRRKRKKLWEYKPRKIVIRKDFYEYDDPSSLTPRQKLLWARKRSIQFPEYSEDPAIYSNQIFTNCAVEANLPNKIFSSSFVGSTDMILEDSLIGKEEVVLPDKILIDKPEKDETSPRIKRKKMIHKLNKHTKKKQKVLTFAKLNLEAVDTTNTSHEAGKSESVYQNETQILLGHISNHDNPVKILYDCTEISIQNIKPLDRQTVLDKMHRNTSALLQSEYKKHKCYLKTIIEMEIHKLQNYKSITTQCINQINNFSNALTKKECCTIGLA